MATTNNTGTNGKAKNGAETKIPDVSAEIRPNGILSLSFADGRLIEVNPDTLDATIRSQAILHGLKQKLVDAAAIGRDLVTGRSATIDDKYAAVREVWDRISGADGEPTWNKVREAGSGGQGQGLLVAALMELSHKTKREIEEFLSTKSKEEKAALRKNQKIAEIILRLQTEKVDTSIDTDGMLAGLGVDIGEGTEGEEGLEEIGEGDEEGSAEQRAYEEAHAEQS